MDHSKTKPTFTLKRQSVQQLDVDELSSVVAGGTTAACCWGCETDGATMCRCPPKA